ncbi:hypothetical protein TraAM80_00946 [Trypanosoma rangeli]|uniref:CNNM transmembrane domain-containing protein n=1 Tax=Trypanosoma rangeli TaxID=5698 RepID=A0A3R7LBY6_TRYRA|nr:uncharacterized protein TraAM80_00946 [Trypanosoma rangeli]RNF11310.1 hypothetical protein TraAM80_00946 [Trypanosoma rangeli]|eukprot:RNF11310.1 hypothetical protein TraAM80_00946 [Trypanosoma rangeli]
MGQQTLAKSEELAYLLGIIGLLLFTGITAGIQVALFSMDRMFLRILTTTGSPQERRRAKCLLDILELEHWTLVALLFANASAMTGVPILLERVFDQLTALLLSITAVLFLSDIIPLSIFVRWSFPMCSFFVPLIWLLVVVTAPVSYPAGKLLDYVLGRKDYLLRRDELEALFLAQQKETAFLRESEVNMLTGALRLSSHRVQDFVVTTCDKAFMLSSRTRLDKKTVENILIAGYSRIPVYLNDNRLHILGALIVQSLIKLCFTNPQKPPRAGDYPLMEMLRLPASTTLYNTYRAFHEHSSNMAVVYDDCGVMIGLWTLTDLLNTLYNPGAPQHADNTRRQELMVGLLESVKVLSATRRKVQPPAEDDRVEFEEFPRGERDI